jgi:hypothetical protein
MPYPIIFERDHWIYRDYGIWPHKYEFVVMDHDCRVYGKFLTISSAKEAIDTILENA